MATDERGTWIFPSRMWVGALKARSEAAEQRGREAREDHASTIEALKREQVRLVGAEHEIEQLEAKLATAVGALKDALDLIDCMTDESRGVSYVEIEDEEERLRRALSELEQGDTK